MTAVVRPPRVGATDAALLYRETDASARGRARSRAAPRRGTPRRRGIAGRPTKRERRKLEDFLNEP